MLLSIELAVGSVLSYVGFWGVAFAGVVVVVTSWSTRLQLVRAVCLLLFASCCFLLVSSSPFTLPFPFALLPAGLASCA